MWWKRFYKTLVVCAVTIGCLGTTVWAADSTNYQEELEHKCVTETIELQNNSIARASGALNADVSANSNITSSESIYLNAQETVTFNCSYTPASASMDFGLIADDGTFYYLNVTNGSINKTIQISKRGYYTLAVRNNASYDVSITGYVNY